MTSAKEYIDERKLPAIYEEMTAEVLKVRPQNVERFLLEFLKEKQKEDGNKTSNGQNADITKKETLLNNRLVDREPFSSDLARYDEFVAETNAQRSDKVCTDFWTKLREDLVPFTGPLGWPKSSDKDLVVVEAELVEKVMQRFFGAHSLVNLAPLELSHKYKIDEYTILTELFHGCKTGLFKMLWSPECPRCGGNASVCDDLRSVPLSAQCPACNFSADFSALDEVKVYFVLHPEVFYLQQKVDSCNVNMKALAKCVLVTPSLPPSQISLGYIQHVDLKKGKYRWLCPFCRLDFPIIVDGDLPEDDKAPRIPFTVRDTTMCCRIIREPFHVAHGKLEFHIYPDGQSLIAGFLVPEEVSEEELFDIGEHPPVTAASTVINHPVFQDFFGSQVVSATQKMEIQNVVLAFTDVVGSTAQYAKLGDGKAMSMVQSHFEILFDEVRSSEGRVVKTVGDAVMASFLSGGKAIEAFVKGIQRLEAFNNSAECPEGGKILIRVGLHRGAAIVVPLNGINDYFGQNVNTAARIEGKSSPNKILVTESVLKQKSAKETLDRLKAEGVVTTEEVEPLELKGVAGKVAATLLTIHVK